MPTRSSLPDNFRFIPGQSNTLSKGLVAGMQKFTGNRTGQAAQQRVNEVRETFANTKAVEITNNLQKFGIKPQRIKKGGRK